MAQELDDGEFWLPSEFLTDDDLLMDFKTDYSKSKRADDFSLGFGSFSGFNSDLSSPVESVMGSTETESDEDEFISGLTRKMAHSTINDVSLSKVSTFSELFLFQLEDGLIFFWNLISILFVGVEAIWFAAVNSLRVQTRVKPEQPK